MIAVERLSHSFDSRCVFSDVTFSIDEGEIVALVGPSGAGKTTLLRCIAGLLRPASGIIAIREDLPVAAVRAQRIGILFQKDLLLEWRTVEENLALPFEVLSCKPNPSLIKQRISEALSLVGLSTTNKLFPYQLSGGMRQRVALARALISKPRVLLLDEPFAAVDVGERERIMVELRAIFRTARTSVIVVTHHLEEALFLCDRLLVLGGRPATIQGSLEPRLSAERDLGILDNPVFLSNLLHLKRKLREMSSLT